MTPNFSTLDHQMMAKAIKLAAKGRFTTAPNPNVGCVITLDDQIVGEGFHFKAGEPHAEVHAIRQAGDKTQGATAYVTLEPCSHYGRTPPCAEGLIKAGVSRVVCAMSDPNPQVAGRGFSMLREAGIQVDVGLLEQESRRLNPGFLTKMETGHPFVQLKLAASLDGQTALANGKSQWITAVKARQDVQCYRALSGAILSTSKTVIDDNASLNVRWDDLPSSVSDNIEPAQLRQPARIILDRQNQLSANSELKIHHTDGELLIVSESDRSDVAIVVENNKIDLPQLLETLASRHNVNHLWVEAGATLAKSFVEQGLVDELIIYLAPKLMGADGRGLFSSLGFAEMSEVINLDIQDLRMVGSDIRVTAKIVKKKD
ncbi:bifunctional diaminohydroxyphosphoribosylaminopyrimidine deaminase/5-amino-6-(5-phosphoribosylamino)uracil reductase RibD [Vibrio maerlii]|uniref:bifunctional diaminohydroxyphosphoribosylaminopyrimidine deaminase/5-amino-6-(5-phosphoribosylamino)uracil reductase RibD n=1 Tax=Vibrio maerlii TaxID=2231648 RepID=UPI000E3D92C5|nr:bifunctional diaminohydroxyphosphoribosylaminopyrimidine deaminase/5-amino-6-(5-phosphoribosylamino)uracil reductase RibD [Vibrio maerlii]